MRTMLAIVTAALTVARVQGVVVIDEGAATPRDQRQRHAAWLGFRPGDGQRCRLNPPRFSWPYNPGTVVPRRSKNVHSFTLQVSTRADMSRLVVDILGLTHNFHNALAPLEGSYHWFWRVGYDVGTERECWSRIREFSIQPGAVVWDRRTLGDLGSRLQGHPRIIFTPENTAALRALRESDPESARIWDACVARADAAMRRNWLSGMPETDAASAGKDCVYFRKVAEDMTAVVFAWMLTGDAKYLSVKEPLLALAAYPPKGESSPEGLGSRRKWGTKITMDMGVCLDWLYPVLSESERAVVIESLRWRVEHIWQDFSWYRGGAPAVGGLAMFVSSHPYEDYLWTLVGALATYEHLEVSRRFCDLGLNYLAGVTSGFGPEGSWNEGVAYGNWKCFTLLTASLYAQMALPELRLELNPFYSEVGRFFTYLTPVGMARSAWGNYATSPGTHLGQHVLNFRRLAALSGDGNLLTNWQACVEARGSKSSLWQEYAIPHFLPLPVPARDEPHHALFNTSGWAMAFSGPPSDPSTFRDGVGILFHCRPRGGYSHSFNNENAFEMFAYGSVIATGGGRKSNGDRHAAHTMSHNAVLVDGLGQRFDHYNADVPAAGRIVAWHAEPGLVYWCGDATNAYRSKVPYLRRALRHVLFIDDAYAVIYDDLAADKPARFSWLYHVHQDVPLATDSESGTLRYAVGRARVEVRHLHRPRDLDFVNMRGEDGYRNVLTGEDMLGHAKASVESSPLRKWSGDAVWNNVWSTNREPAEEWQFLAAIVPGREGDTDDLPRVVDTSDRSLTVKSTGGTKTIWFGPASAAEPNADVVVDVERTRLLAGDSPTPPSGPVVWEADLSDTTGWRFDGDGTVEHQADGVLRINNGGRTVYWADAVLESPVLFDFEIRTTDEKCRAILFFMAEGVNGEDIFGRERAGDYGDYAYAGTMELYTVGLLREGCGTETNFRYLGGELPGRLRILKQPAAGLTQDRKAAYRQAVRDFQPYSIPSTTMDGCVLGAWWRYRVLVDGKLVRVWCDGRLLHEVVDPTPLSRGRVGFRNFRRDTSVEVRAFRALRPGG